MAQLERWAADQKFGNKDERFFIAACRGWMHEAAEVDILLDFAYVLDRDQRYDARDDVLRLRQKWLKKFDPETYKDQKKRGLFQPGSFKLPTN